MDRFTSFHCLEAEPPGLAGLHSARPLSINSRVWISLETMSSYGFTSCMNSARLPLFHCRDSNSQMRVYGRNSKQKQKGFSSPARETTHFSSVSKDLSFHTNKMLMFLFDSSASLLCCLHFYFSCTTFSRAEEEKYSSVACKELTENLNLLNLENLLIPLNKKTEEISFFI